MVDQLASLGLKMPQDAAVLAAALPWQHNLRHLSIPSRYLWALSGLTWWWDQCLVVLDVLMNHVRLTLL